MNGNLKIKLIFCFLSIGILAQSPSPLAAASEWSLNNMINGGWNSLKQTFSTPNLCALAAVSSICLLSGSSFEHVTEQVLLSVFYGTIARSVYACNPQFWLKRFHGNQEACNSALMFAGQAPILFSSFPKFTCALGAFTLLPAFYPQTTT